jgi:hypothetical protein
MQRPWQKYGLQQEKSRRQKDRWLSVSIVLVVLVALAVLIGLKSMMSQGQTTHVSPPVAPEPAVMSQHPTYSAIKGMWLGAEESIWFHTLGEPVSRKTVGDVVILTMPLTHVQGIGAFYLEERVGMHTVIAIDLIAPSVWNRQDGVSLCSASAGEEVRLGHSLPLEAVGAGFSQSLTVTGSPVQGSMSVFYNKGNSQAIKACTASLGSHISLTYTPPV